MYARYIGKLPLQGLADLIVGPRAQQGCLGRVDVPIFNQQLYEYDWSCVFLRVFSCVQKWRAFVDVFTRQLDSVAPVCRVPIRPVPLYRLTHGSCCCGDMWHGHAAHVIPTEGKSIV